MRLKKWVPLSTTLKNSRKKNVISIQQTLFFIFYFLLNSMNDTIK